MAVPDKPLTEAEMARSLLLAVDPARALGWTAEPPQSQFLGFTDVDARGHCCAVLWSECQAALPRPDGTGGTCWTWRRSGEWT